ncbi:MAG: hypothetical protein RLP44_15615 [Aggregatilineales bacterium]
MTDLEALFKTLDSLDSDELQQVEHYIEQRKNHQSVWEVAPETLAEINSVMRSVQTEAAQLSDDEINTIINEAIDEVRHDRKNSSSH